VPRGALRYILAVSSERVAEFEAICRRERCPYAVIGHATEAQVRLLLAPAPTRRAAVRERKDPPHTVRWCGGRCAVPGTT